MTRPFRWFAPTALALALVSNPARPPAALAQAPGQALEAAPDPTKGFFDMPAREGDDGSGTAVPGYFVTSLVGFAAIFALCKSARR